MSTWNYRLIKHIYPKGEVHYAVHEYYPATDEVGEAWTLSPVALWGETPDDIRWIISRVRYDLGRLLDKHDIIEVKHDEYGLVHADNTGLKLYETHGDKDDE